MCNIFKSLLKVLEKINLLENEEGPRILKIFLNEKTNRELLRDTYQHILKLLHKISE